MAETDGDTTMAGADTTLNSVTGAGAATTQPRAKKARTEGNGAGDLQMDVDDEMNDASDPEDVLVEDEDEDDDAQEEEEEDEDQGGGDNEEERDELEEREDQPDEDEALDDGNHSD